MPVAAIPFTKVHITGREAEYMRQVIESGRFAGDGPFTRRCEDWLKGAIGSARAFLTTSGTAALEMAAILAGIGPGDEVILPSFTFASTANAFVLRGAVPVFVDIEPHTLNLDPVQVDLALSNRTRAVVPMHYAGVGCDMKAILDLARRADAVVIEDAAQGLLSTWEGLSFLTPSAAAALRSPPPKRLAATG